LRGGDDRGQGRSLGGEQGRLGDSGRRWSLEQPEGPKSFSSHLTLALLELGRNDVDPPQGSKLMPKKRAVVRNPWTKEELRQLKAHSKARTPVVDVAKAMKRTEGAVRQKAKTIGIGLGHRR
jgi:hypothetical protein